MTQLPEIMRPYKELWVDFSDEFFNNPEWEYQFAGRKRIKWVRFDEVFYETSKYYVPLDELMESRLRPNPPVLWDGITDYRAMLDYLGKVKYVKLW